MKRPATKIVVAAVVIGAAMIGVKGARVALRTQREVDTGCGPGFRREGPRCLVAKGCPAPLVATDRGCDAPERDVVDVPRTTVTIGPSDWEAEGRVKPRVVEAGPFRIDRLEVTSGRAFCPTCALADPSRYDPADAARAASGVTRDEARAFCKAKGGRLPTEDEWIVAAAGDRPRRYPWGDTGAVCRRAAWGLVKGPCATGADGPDTAGSHPDGATPSGIHDLAGNVAEWVELPSGGGSVRGGSYETELATELRTWPRREVSETSRERSIGFRCAYDVP
jgi:formylglycine-generating enzyme required for sulfatase activity